MLILTVVVFLTPTIAFACDAKSEKTEKTCCDNTSETKSCCDNHSEKDGDGCEGKCGSTSCQCPASNFATVLSFDIEIKLPQIFFEKEAIVYKESCVSSDCFSVWAPPKIS
ncbi:hypothetical protein [Flavobacterium sp.]|uniref:hypothetical protein n=1 Tax=Flavobacterium sp. TaxID=239 RepID=UPI0028BE9A56|nr:hypothetical protein [Flavobacterium sp.]